MPFEQHSQPVQVGPGVDIPVWILEEHLAPGDPPGFQEGIGTVILALPVVNQLAVLLDPGTGHSPTVLRPDIYIRNMRKIYKETTCKTIVKRRKEKKQNVVVLF